ncbi:hypothetical protein BN2497_10469 [Janthinobacterium sp. CG23_2]|nr:hypothetical protein BN2497_10469 [Janthinobacterium sp. CG23_2]CUU31632.1 hypothetical protein BN3177_10469 [Janthinobacterium sp. CG23_2]
MSLDRRGRDTVVLDFFTVVCCLDIGFQFYRLLMKHFLDG